MFEQVLGFFVMLLLLSVAGAFIYKYRDDIKRHITHKPLKDGILRDLEVLHRYEVDDRLKRIIGKEEAWERDVQSLRTGIDKMKKQIKAKTETGGG